MLLSLNWLKDYVAIPRTISPEDLGLKLTMHTVEIDDVIKEAEKYNNIVIGKILEVRAHPDADKLQIAVVDIGDKDSKLEIVCGASNIESGQLVPVALIGAVLPNELEIKATKIRGIESFGMLCAEDELGLGDDHAGILILDSKAKIGTPLGEYLKLKDVIYEVDNKSITNRPDLWGHFGMAREIAAFLQVKFKDDLSLKKAQDIKINDTEFKFNVEVENYDLCPRYMAIGVSGIKIEESPKWLQERLIAVGERPINNIVDITNYVMLETGQPLHAFDKEFIKEIVVRSAKKNEAIKTLDGEDRKLNETDIIIADKKSPIAIAGVMGGENSEINNETDGIIIEAANFNFLSVRKTAQRLGLRTEASKRFEKSLDPNLCEIALVRVVELIKKICPQARVSSPVKDKSDFELSLGPILLDLEWLGRYIGMEIEIEAVISILKRLGFGVEKDKDNILAVSIPTWRATKDIQAKEDLAEEVARMIGYDNIVPTKPLVEMRVPEEGNERLTEYKIKEILVNNSEFSECYNYSFVGEKQLAKLGIDYEKHICLANPIISHQSLLRQSLIPNMLENIKLNQSRFLKIGLFEIGNVFLSITGSVLKNNKNKEALPYQEKRLVTALALEKNQDVYRALKGKIENLFNHFNIDVRYEEQESGPAWSDARADARINYKKINLGSIHIVNQKITNSLNLKKKTAIAEFSLPAILEAIKTAGEINFQEFDKFPPVIRDIALVVNKKTSYNDISDAIKSFHEDIKKVELFDVYEDEKLGKNKKNLAFHIIYQADKTFVSEEIDKLQQELMKSLEKKFEAKIRDF